MASHLQHLTRWLLWLTWMGFWLREGRRRLWNVPWQLESHSQWRGAMSRGGQPSSEAAKAGETPSEDVQSYGSMEKHPSSPSHIWKLKAAKGSLCPAVPSPGVTSALGHAAAAPAELLLTCPWTSHAAAAAPCSLQHVDSLLLLQRTPSSFLASREGGTMRCQQLWVLGLPSLPGATAGAHTAV